MPTQIEVKRLSGVDRGKHVRLMVSGGKHADPWELAGTLLSVSHWGDGLSSMTVMRDDGPAIGSQIPADTVITITGKPS